MGVEWSGGYTGMAIGLANKVAGALSSKSAQPGQSAQPGAQAAKPQTSQPSAAAASRNKDSFESPGVVGQFFQYISGGAIR